MNFMSLSIYLVVKLILYTEYVYPILCVHTCTLHNDRTMSIALFVGIPVVALCYLLVNIAFFAVLSYEDILGAEAVALVSQTIDITLTNAVLYLFHLLLDICSCMYMNMYVHCIYANINYCVLSCFNTATPLHYPINRCIKFCVLELVSDGISCQK